MPIRHRGRADRASQAEVSISQRRDLFPAVLAIKEVVRRPCIGFEPTVSSYITNLVAVFREVRRVINKNGVPWIVIGDSYASNGGKWRQDAYKVNRPQKQLVSVGTWYPGSDLTAGNLMMVPARLALALQDDGWLLRQEIIWDKGWVRPESARDRVTRTHDTVYMLCKNKDYFYDQDPIRDPLISSGGQKPDAVDRDTRTDFRVYNNPLGRNSGSVWRINSSNYRGAHTATFPPELVRRMIEWRCDDDLSVMDVFGGAGTTALVALNWNTVRLRSTSIQLTRMRRAPGWPTRPAGFPRRRTILIKPPACRRAMRAAWLSLPNNLRPLVEYLARRFCANRCHGGRGAWVFCMRSAGLVVRRTMLVPPQRRASGIACLGACRAAGERSCCSLE